MKYFKKFLFILGTIGLTCAFGLSHYEYLYEMLPLYLFLIWVISFVIPSVSIILLIINEERFNTCITNLIFGLVIGLIYNLSGQDWFGIIETLNSYKETYYMNFDEDIPQYDKRYFSSTREGFFHQQVFFFIIGLIITIVSTLRSLPNLLSSIMNPNMMPLRNSLGNRKKGIRQKLLEKSFRKKLYDKVLLKLSTWAIMGVLTFIISSILEISGMMSFLIYFGTVVISAIIGVLSDYEID